VNKTQNGKKGNASSGLFRKGELVRVKRVDEMATVIADRGKRILVKMAGKYDDFVCWLARDEVEKSQFKNPSPDPKILAYLKQEIAKIEKKDRVLH
jgi:hypothetical protein